MPLSRFDPSNIERFAVIHPAGFKDRPPDDPGPDRARVADIMIVVAGGAGKHSVFVPTFGATRSVTRRIEAVSVRRARASSAGPGCLLAGAPPPGRART